MKQLPLFKNDIESELITVDEIESGDLLAWRGDKYTPFSSFLISTVKFLTGSQYGHVGIAYKCNDGIKDNLLAVEATLPKIRAQMLSGRFVIDVVKLNVDWNDKLRDYLLTKLGHSYSLMDALKAQLGIPLKDDDDYQCAEFAHYFYEEAGIKLKHDFTPGGIVQAAVEYSKHDVRRLIL